MDLRKFTLICALGLVTAGCASVDNQEAAAADDPLEPMNRTFFDFNQRLDRHAILPAATFYNDNVPAPARHGVHNFLTNLSGPVDFANEILEAHFRKASQVAARFVLNSTFGVAGIFDVASGAGLPAHDCDFGETLGTYGVPQGPYLVAPILGPTAVRDVSGNVVDGFFSPLYYLHLHYTGGQYVGLAQAAATGLDTRAVNISTYNDIQRASVDFYATVRGLYRQRRDAQVADSPAKVELPDF